MYVCNILFTFCFTCNQLNKDHRADYISLRLRSVSFCSSEETQRASGPERVGERLLAGKITGARRNLPAPTRSGPLALVASPFDIFRFPGLILRNRKRPGCSLVISWL